MIRILMIMLLLVTLCPGCSLAQKKYGYAIIYMRCGNEDPWRNRAYFSPIIELNILDFEKYTKGIDPLIPKRSVRYYNYAILRWFEIYLKENRNIAYNDPERYERKAALMVFNDTGHCNIEKTDTSCFFSDKQQLVMIRNKAINETKQRQEVNQLCEVIAL